MALLLHTSSGDDPDKLQFTVITVQQKFLIFGSFKYYIYISVTNIFCKTLTM